jgi:hypothetical protein
MFEVPGIGADDVAWIERDQFVYFTEVERSLSDLSDWPRFKHDLARALTTALALPAIPSDDDIRSSGVPAPVSALLDRVSPTARSRRRVGTLPESVVAGTSFVRGPHETTDDLTKRPLQGCGK